MMVEAISNHSRVGLISLLLHSLFIRWKNHVSGVFVVSGDLTSFPSKISN
jgi:hypothetical protein